MSDKLGGDQAKPMLNARSMGDENWYWVGKSILSDYGRGIGVFGIAVYNCLAFYANSAQTCYPSQQRMAETLGCSRGAVNKAIKALEANGLIVLERRGRCPQLYRILKVPCNSSKPLLSPSRDFDVALVRTNDIKRKRNNNDSATQAEVIHNASKSGNFKPVVQSEFLAVELAEALDDRHNLPLYITYSRKYPESLLRGVIREVLETPSAKIKKSRAALFNYLIQTYGKRQTNNPSD